VISTVICQFPKLSNYLKVILLTCCVEKVLKTINYLVVSLEMFCHKARGILLTILTRAKYFGTSKPK